MSLRVETPFFSYRGKRVTSRITLLLLLALQAPIHALPVGSIESAFNVMQAMNMDAVENNAPKARRISAYYDKHMAAHQSPLSLKQQSTGDLQLLFNAAFLVDAYTFKENYLDHMRMDLDELLRRGPVSDKLLLDFHASLIQARKFDEATAFRQRHPGLKLPELPRIVEQEREGPTALVLHEENGIRTLRREALSVSDGLKILVISHPRCHFSQYAVRDLMDDPVLGPVFRDHAVWLMPQDGDLALSSLERWNQDHPGAPLSIAYRESDWPVVTQWATPTFYVLDRGKLVGEVDGWPREGNRAALMAALKQAGLLK
ncbi:hypothetical protein KK141_14110 [Dyella sp. LX-66]|uniref:hypothetical protein n=1 Tax=unclassified Dyella TaxID=2634549 RepID=UPI001BE0F550|nr:MULTISPECIES: hypothetical protein [unclassified Dyella]MBT2116381.1 hypothetical protein [Dyella sp. LX-1]MBT2140676.1 hypothetical protein [Dyella sp. LX-66]